VSDRPPITDVTGGSHGQVVAYEHALALADDYEVAGGRMRDWASRGGQTLGNGDLLESALLSPLTFAEAEGAVLAATSGPDGILVESVVWEADALTIRVRVRATQLTDELVAEAWERLDYTAGQTLGFGLAAFAPELAVGGLALALVWSQLPDDVRRDLEEGAAEDVQEWLNQHPDVVQHLVNGSGGLLDGLWDGLAPATPGGPLGVPLFTPDAESAAALLAGPYHDGPVHTEPTMLTVPSSATAPADLAGLIHHLGEVNELSDADHPEHNGTIEIQTITAPDGSVSHVVYLPGTDDMATTPWSQDGDVRDLGTNLLLVSGQDNGYQHGILEAMAQAGIRAGQPVVLVGHSQGGMEAAAILAQANDQSQNGGGAPYTITNVVTAGAPTAQLDGGFPRGSHVLSLENEGDVVPLLDGEDNPDSAEQVTVRFDDHETSVGGNHDLGHYVAGAGAAQASDDPSIQEQIASLTEHGFIGAGSGHNITSQIFQITRDP
jgi:hypothetical protein